jgi:hypothetical protein
MSQEVLCVMELQSWITKFLLIIIIIIFFFFFLDDTTVQCGPSPP